MEECSAVVKWLLVVSTAHLWQPFCKYHYKRQQNLDSLLEPSTTPGANEQWGGTWVRNGRNGRVTGKVGGKKVAWVSVAVIYANILVLPHSFSFTDLGPVLAKQVVQI